MNLLPSLLHLSLIHIAMAAIPGPNTVVIGHMSASVSRRAGLRAASGVTFASLIWVLLSLAGSGVILLEVGMLYRLIRLAGAGYLIYVGIRMLWRPAKIDPAASEPHSGKPPFRAGLLTTLSNPKSAVFWTSIFALVIPPHAPLWFYIAVAVMVTVQSAAWYSAVALVLSAALARRQYARLSLWLDRIAGSIMILLGLAIAEELRTELAARTL